MPIDAPHFWRQVRLGEDSELEFKEVRFKGARVSSPKRAAVADELAALANSPGGRLVFGVTDQRNSQPLRPDQMDAVADFVTELCNDSIDPPLDFSLHRVPTPEQPDHGALVVEVPAGRAVHRSPGGFFRRRGNSKRPMGPAEIRRLLQARGRSDAESTDTQVVAGTGVATLDPKLWRRYASSRTGDADEIALSKLKFVKEDAQGVVRATVGGVLLASRDPREWLPSAFIQAVCYAGDRMDGDRQLDAQDIAGPLDQQIRDAVRFVERNRRVAARKEPARRDVPQFSDRAVFEALVNALVHRDYAVSGSKTRLFVFDDRLELYSPGALGNSMSVEDLRTSQFTRNELLASRLGQCRVGDVAGAGGRLYFIERRGEGVGVIEDETFALAGRKPLFEVVSDRELKLVLPAASPPVPDGVRVRVAVVHADTGQPLRDVHVLMIYPNKTFREARTDAFGPRRLRAVRQAADDRVLRRPRPRCPSRVRLPAGRRRQAGGGGANASRPRRRFRDLPQPNRPRARAARQAEPHPRQLRPPLRLRRQRGRRRRRRPASSLPARRVPRDDRRPRGHGCRPVPRGDRRVQRAGLRPRSSRPVTTVGDNRGLALCSHFSHLPHWSRVVFNPLVEARERRIRGRQP